MSLRWIHEQPAMWDESKRKIVGGAPEGALDLQHGGEGELLPGDWWRVEDDGTVVGYGWMDHSWGDAEILLAVADETQGRGVGTFILDKLEEEARTLGVNYLYNVVRETHPDRAGITRWLQKRRFKRSHDDNLLRRTVQHPH